MSTLFALKSTKTCFFGDLSPMSDPGPHLGHFHCLLCLFCLMQQEAKEILDLYKHTPVIELLVELRKYVWRHNWPNIGLC